MPITQRVGHKGHTNVYSAIASGEKATAGAEAHQPRRAQRPAAATTATTASSNTLKTEQNAQQKAPGKGNSEATSGQAVAAAVGRSKASPSQPATAVAAANRSTASAGASGDATTAKKVDGKETSSTTLPPRGPQQERGEKEKGKQQRSERNVMRQLAPQSSESEGPNGPSVGGGRGGDVARAPTPSTPQVLAAIGLEDAAAATSATIAAALSGGGAKGKPLLARLSLKGAAAEDASLANLSAITTTAEGGSAAVTTTATKGSEAKDKAANNNAFSAMTSFGTKVCTVPNYTVVNSSAPLLTDATVKGLLAPIVPLGLTTTMLPQNVTNAKINAAAVARGDDGTIASNSSSTVRITPFGRRQHHEGPSSFMADNRRLLQRQAAAVAAAKRDTPGFRFEAKAAAIVHEKALRPTWRTDAAFPLPDTERNKGALVEVGPEAFDYIPSGSKEVEAMRRVEPMPAPLRRIMEMAEDDRRLIGASEEEAERIRLQIRIARGGGGEASGEIAAVKGAQTVLAEIARVLRESKARGGALAWSQQQQQHPEAQEAGSISQQQQQQQSTSSSADAQNASNTINANNSSRAAVEGAAAAVMRSDVSHELLYRFVRSHPTEAVAVATKAISDVMATRPDRVRARKGQKGHTHVLFKDVFKDTSAGAFPPAALRATNADLVKSRAGHAGDLLSGERTRGSRVGAMMPTANNSNSNMMMSTAGGNMMKSVGGDFFSSNGALGGRLGTSDGTAFRASLRRLVAQHLANGTHRRHSHSSNAVVGDDYVSDGENDDEKDNSGGLMAIVALLDDAAVLQPLRPNFWRALQQEEEDGEEKEGENEGTTASPDGLVPDISTSPYPHSSASAPTFSDADVVMSLVAAAYACPPSLSAALMGMTDGVPSSVGAAWLHDPFTAVTPSAGALHPPPSRGAAQCRSGSQSVGASLVAVVPPPAAAAVTSSRGSALLSATNSGFPMRGGLHQRHSNSNRRQGSDSGPLGNDIAAGDPDLEGSMPRSVHASSSAPAGSSATATPPMTASRPNTNATAFGGGVLEGSPFAEAMRQLSLSRCSHARFLATLARVVKAQHEMGIESSRDSGSAAAAEASLTFPSPTSEAAAATDDARNGGGAIAFTAEKPLRVIAALGRHAASRDPTPEELEIVNAIIAREAEGGGGTAADATTEEDGTASTSAASAARTNAASNVAKRGGADDAASAQHRQPSRAELLRALPKAASNNGILTAEELVETVPHWAALYAHVRADALKRSRIAEDDEVRRNPLPADFEPTCVICWAQYDQCSDQHMVTLSSPNPPTASSVLAAMAGTANSGGGGAVAGVGIGGRPLSRAALRGGVGGARSGGVIVLDSFGLPAANASMAAGHSGSGSFGDALASPSLDPPSPSDEALSLHTTNNGSFVVTNARGIAMDLPPTGGGMNIADATQLITSNSSFVSGQFSAGDDTAGANSSTARHHHHRTLLPLLTAEQRRALADEQRRHEAEERESLLQSSAKAESGLTHWRAMHHFVNVRQRKAIERAVGCREASSALVNSSPHHLARLAAGASEASVQWRLARSLAPSSSTATAATNHQQLQLHRGHGGGGGGGGGTANNDSSSAAVEGKHDDNGRRASTADFPLDPKYASLEWSAAAAFRHKHSSGKTMTNPSLTFLGGNSNINAPAPLAISGGGGPQRLAPIRALRANSAVEGGHNDDGDSFRGLSPIPKMAIAGGRRAGPDDDAPRSFASAAPPSAGPPTAPPSAGALSPQPSTAGRLSRAALDKNNGSHNNSMSRLQQSGAGAAEEAIATASDVLSTASIVRRRKGLNSLWDRPRKDMTLQAMRWAEARRLWGRLSGLMALLEFPRASTNSNDSSGGGNNKDNDNDNLEALLLRDLLSIIIADRCVRRSTFFVWLRVAVENDRRRQQELEGKEREKEVLKRRQQQQQQQSRHEEGGEDRGHHSGAEAMQPAAQPPTTSIMVRGGAADKKNGASGGNNAAIANLGTFLTDDPTAAAGDADNQISPEEEATTSLLSPVSSTIAAGPRRARGLQPSAKAAERGEPADASSPVGPIAPPSAGPAPSTSSIATTTAPLFHIAAAADSSSTSPLPPIPPSRVVHFFSSSRRGYRLATCAGALFGVDAKALERWCRLPSQRALGWKAPSDEGGGGGGDQPN